MCYLSHSLFSLGIFVCVSPFVGVLGYECATVCKRERVCVYDGVCECIYVSVFFHSLFLCLCVFVCVSSLMCVLVCVCLYVCVCWCLCVTEIEILLLVYAYMCIFVCAHIFVWR